MPLKVQPCTLKTQPCSFLCSKEVLPGELAAAYFSRFSGSHFGVTRLALLPECFARGWDPRGERERSSVEHVFIDAC